MSPIDKYLQSPEWHENRRGTIRGSDANILAKGRPLEVLQLFKLKTGRSKPSAAFPNLRMLLGQVTEPINADWFVATTGRKIWGRNSDFIHPIHDFLGLSADGITTSVDGREAYWEAKFCQFDVDLPELYDQHADEFRRMIRCRAWCREVVLPRLVEKYYPQLMHAMFVGDWEVAVFCPIISGEQYPVEIEFDHDYWERLFELEQEFWWHVTEDREPGESVMRGLGWEES